MIVLVVPDATDDDDLVTPLNGFLTSLLEDMRPDEVHIVRIRNWFDHKWLGYSGRGVVDFPGADFAGIDVALDDVRQTELTFPPFTPKRVSGQHSFRRVSGGQYELFDRPPLHVATVGGRNKDLHRRVTLQAESAVFAWFASGSLTNGRGALMVYAVDQGTASGWYVSFIRTKGWQVHRTKGVDQNRIEGWFQRKAASPAAPGDT